MGTALAATGLLTVGTSALAQTKGRVLQAIEDINRLAKNAFDGQAALVSQFNKDILLRARQEKKTDETTEEPPLV